MGILKELVIRLVPLGSEHYKGTSFFAYALTGLICVWPFTQGVALCYCLSGFQPLRLGGDAVALSFCRLPFSDS